ncbi:MAG: hypothetical protein ABI794_07090, partial [Betaproteobacteria bacterium]
MDVLAPPGLVSTELLYPPELDCAVGNPTGMTSESNGALASQVPYVQAFGHGQDSAQLNPNGTHSNTDAHALSSGAARYRLPEGRSGTAMTDRRKFVLGSIDGEEEPDLYATNPDWFRSVFDSGTQEVEGSKRSFVIRAADSAGQRSHAALLINKMYAWRGYGDDHVVEERPDQMALV